MYLRKAAIALMILLGLTTSFAKRNDPCKDCRENTDAFGKTTKGNMFRLDMNGYTAISLLESEGKVTLTTMFVRAGATASQIPAGSMLTAALTDGTVIDIPTSQDSEAVRSANSALVFTQWQVVADIDKTVLNKLTSSPLKAIKIKVENQDVIDNVPEKKGRKLQNVAKCLSGITE